MRTGLCQSLRSARPALAFILVLGRTCGVSCEEFHRVTARIDSDDYPRILSLLEYHRVAPQVLHNMRAHSAHSCCQFGPELERVVPTLEHMIEEDAALRDLNRATLISMGDWMGGGLVGIKGVSMEQFYVHSLREPGDLDVFVKDDDLFRLLSCLVKNGFRFSKVRFSKARPLYEDAWEGYFGICTAFGPDGWQGVEVDIHFGAFPACGPGYVSIRPEDGHGCVDGRRLLSPTKSILVSLAHIARQGFVRMRDVNDFHLASKCVDFSEDEVAAGIEHYGLRSTMEAVAPLVCGCYGGDSHPVWSTEGRVSSILSRALLTQRMVRSRRHTDGMAFGPGRLVQLGYLQENYRRHYSIWRRGGYAVRDSLGLLVAGRPYRVWRRVPRAPVEKQERFVLTPVGSYSIPNVAEHRTGEPGFDGPWLPGLGLRVVDPGHRREFLVSDDLVFVRASYRGDRYDASGTANARRRLDGMGAVFEPID